VPHNRVVDVEAMLTSVADGVRDQRAARGLTLDQLAKRAGLSTAHLSRIESGDRQPSLGALISLSRALGVSVGALLGEGAEGPGLAVYGDEQPSHAVNGLTVTSAGGFPGSSVIEALRVTIDPQREPPTPARHRGEEWIYVLRGCLRLEYGDEVHVLAPGSTVHFDADRPHRLGAEQVATEVLLVTADTPSFPASLSTITDH
jgi:transcriptional regulator with XRE-family HTH domain